MTRLLGIDLGERRIGLATAEPGRDPAVALRTIARAASIAADAASVAAVVREQSIDVLVVGLPLEANGDEGPMALASRAWAAAIGDMLALPVRLRDERFSSQRAEGRVGRMPRGRSGGPPSPTQRDRYRARVDSEAAAIILEAELEALAGSAGGAGDAP